jgi:O-antigen/teichoic acid export membrane protein
VNPDSAALATHTALLVPFCFGDEFHGAVPLVRILVVAAALTAIRRVLTEGLRGQGAPGIGSIAELIAWAVLAPTLAIFDALWEAQGVAIAMVITALAGLVAIAIGIATSRYGPQRLVARPTPIAPSEERF